MDEKQHTLVEVQDFIGHNNINVSKDRLLLYRYDPEEMTEGGIIIAEQAQRTPICGIVLRNGTENPKWRPGTSVYFRPHSDVRIPLGHTGDGPEVSIVHFKDVLAEEV